MKIYVVTSGQYSDYGINGVFTVKEKAQKYVDIYNACEADYDSARIEEYEADIIDVSGFWFGVSKYDTGKLYCSTYDVRKGGYDLTVVRHSEFVHVFVFADSIDKAKKIALDRFTQFEAQEAGI